MSCYDRCHSQRLKRHGPAVCRNLRRDTRLLRGRLGTRLPVGDTENIRAALGLFATCEGSTQNFDITGSVTFEHFGVEKGARIKAEIVGLEVRDGRSAASGGVLGFLQGNCDFDVRLGPPYQRFQD